MSRARKVARRAAVVAGALTSRVAARFGDGVAVATNSTTGQRSERATSISAARGLRASVARRRSGAR